MKSRKEMKKMSEREFHEHGLDPLNAFHTSYSRYFDCTNKCDRECAFVACTNVT